jgi:hypothetical protein
MTRICSACGIEKPLAAFLEISSTHGTRYGIYCSACRGSGLAEKKNKNEEDPGTLSTTGNRIGLKERSFIEREQKKKIDIEKTERIEQLAKRDATTQEKTDKTIQKENLEKDHRRTYLDLKKQPGFLGKKLPSGSVVPRTIQNTPVLDTKKQEEKNVAQEKEFDKKSTHQEEQKKTFNLKDQYIDPQAGEIRAHNPIFLAFQDSLGASPFKIIRERLNQLAQKKPEAAIKKSAENKDPLLTFVEKTWGGGPSSGRKR